MLRVLLLALFVLSGWSNAQVLAAPLQREPPSGATFEERRDQLLSALVRTPFPKPECGTKGVDSPCIWGKLSLALALLSLPQEVSASSATDASTLISDATKLESARNGFGDTEDEDDKDPAAHGRGVETKYHFTTGLLFHRILATFGPRNQGGDERLSPAISGSIIRLFGAWAGTACTRADADTALVWKPWGSENHDILRAYSCWAAADIIFRDGQDNSFSYRDGSTPAQQRAAWTRFLIAYIQNRGENGLFIEFFSPTYAKYSLSVFYNIFDFSEDKDLKQGAGALLTLWWALWGQEQIDGVHGGSKARRYSRMPPAATPDGGMGWLYTGEGDLRPQVPHPAFLPLVLSSFRPPKVVLDIMRRPGAPESYGVWTRQLGRAAKPNEDGRFVLERETLSLARYTYVGQGFVMGSIIGPTLPAQDWTNISSQNRWMGVALEGNDLPLIYARPDPKGSRSNYNALVGTQEKGLQIVQATRPPFGRAVGDMFIHISRNLERMERGGWIFVRGSAYVAVRPVRGKVVVQANGEDYRLADANAPVIIQASPLSAFPSFEAFQDAILAAQVTDSGSVVTFEGILGDGPLSFPDQGRAPGTVAGRAIAAPEGWTLYSPFVRQKAGSDQVELQFKDEHLILKF
ncbi:hypothetical protein [Aquabacter sediminis]|uniref:hypothetical protein n=1 Tax=Aquabacter sediminis TaxID=3029197 RepID=UPI00237D8637|nr:hypothetical protein [Aquabacter sp. P-9]MDE1567143.1 hypothetical protein [Aquabacter sp. P-9]